MFPKRAQTRPKPSPDPTPPPVAPAPPKPEAPPEPRVLYLVPMNGVSLNDRELKWQFFDKSYWPPRPEDVTQLLASGYDEIRWSGMKSEA
ncbi:MAG: hypothetical protein O7H41_08385 [Planctomycetota bacterium]|nr:hypothetical protein [Planctomycetota bacterium]